MPTFKKITPAQFEKPKAPEGPSKRQIIAQEYDAFLAPWGAEDCVEVEVGSEESKTTIKNRLESAARRRSLWCKWGRGEASTLKFQLKPMDSPPPPIDATGIVDWSGNVDDYLESVIDAAPHPVDDDS